MSDMRAESVGGAAPCPISGGCAWSVHTCIGREPEQILDGGDGDSGDRAPDRAHHAEVDGVRWASQIAQGEILFGIDGLLRSGAAFACNALVPTDDRVVVMRSGVGDGVDGIVVGKIERGGYASAESELDDSHAWEAEGIAKRMDFVGNES